MVLGAGRAAAVGGGVLVGIVDDGQLVEGGGDILGDEEGGTVGHFVGLFVFLLGLRRIEDGGKDCSM